MKQHDLQRKVRRTETDDCLHTVVAPDALLRRVFTEVAPGSAPAERWSKLQQRLRSHHSFHESSAQMRAYGAMERQLCLFIRPRYSLLAPIM
jgi:hypothetical protein